MSLEGQLRDQKSLRVITGKTADWKELAKDCVAFANAIGGKLLIGIEDGDTAPPTGQRIPDGLIDTVQRKIRQNTVNITTLPHIIRLDSGDEYLELQIPRAVAVASTSDGRYFLRIADQSRPLVGEEVMRLANERAALPWETQTSLQIPIKQSSPVLTATLLGKLRASNRVKASVKEKSDSELLAHYLLANGQWLTHLGVLCIGTQADRARLGTAPVVQFIKYDQDRRKVNKISWDDYTQPPDALVDAIWQEIPDFREFYEIPEGMFRQQIPVFEGAVVRELLINALVHRPYTQNGDIFINLHLDRLEIINPGALPLGVTPHNVLHTTRRRNEHLTRLFHDLKLMEREGSGYDTMYEILLTQGRAVPIVEEGSDWVKVTIPRTAPKREIMDFIGLLGQTYQLTQRERITVALLAQHEAMNAPELVKALELADDEALNPWLGHLLEWGLVHRSGRTKGTRYFVNPELLRDNALVLPTTLTRIEPHRLRALVLEDLSRYPNSSISEIHIRIGKEIPQRQVKRALEYLSESEEVQFTGENRWRHYRLST
jgi:ATP-dependent DNA helicase RecG